MRNEKIAATQQKDQQIAAIKGAATQQTDQEVAVTNGKATVLLRLSLLCRRQSHDGFGDEPAGLLDESAISIWRPLSVGPLSLQGPTKKSKESMDARTAPQLEFDANKVRAFIASRYLGINVEQLTDEAHFRNDFGLDSLNQLELLILIEEEFSGVEFSDAAVDRIELVGDLIRYVEIIRLLGDLYTQAFRRSVA